MSILLDLEEMFDSQDRLPIIEKTIIDRLKELNVKMIFEGISDPYFWVNRESYIIYCIKETSSTGRSMWAFLNEIPIWRLPIGESQLEYEVSMSKTSNDFVHLKSGVGKLGYHVIFKDKCLLRFIVKRETGLTHSNFYYYNFELDKLSSISTQVYERKLAEKAVRYMDNYNNLWDEIKMGGLKDKKKQKTFATMVSLDKTIGATINKGLVPQINKRFAGLRKEIQVKTGMVIQHFNPNDKSFVL